MLLLLVQEAKNIQKRKRQFIVCHFMSWSSCALSCKDCCLRHMMICLELCLSLWWRTKWQDRSRMRGSSTKWVMIMRVIKNMTIVNHLRWSLESVVWRCCSFCRKGCLSHVDAERWRRENLLPLHAFPGNSIITGWWCLFLPFSQHSLVHACV